MKKIWFLIAAVYIGSAFLYAEEKKPESEKTAEIQKASIEDDSDESISAIDTIKEVLAYGIESEILETIKTIDKHDFELLDQDCLKLFQETKSPVVKEKLIFLYKKNKHIGLQDEAVSILKNYTEHRRMLVKSVLAYLGALVPEDTTVLSGLLQKIVQEENSDHTIECINVLGKIGNADDAVFLMDFFETFNTVDVQQELVTRQSIAAALEKIHSENAWDFLFELASDENENSYVRASAASALAKIGKQDALEVLTKFFEDPDPLLRTAVMKGIVSFNTPESKGLLLQGFKDPYEKVRLEALHTVKETKDARAVPYVLYRAKKDPVQAVKNAAIETLAVLNDPKGNEWLSENFCDEKKSRIMRTKILEAVMTHNPAILDTHLDTVVLPLITDKKKKDLRYAFGKVLAKIETEKTEQLCIAFLESDDVMTKTIGLDMYKTNRYSAAASLIEKIANDKKQGNLQRIAKRLLQ